MFSIADLAFASQTNGTIDETYEYAWGENIGWLNFGCDRCGVLIADNGISGYAWSKQYGWINLNPSNSGVANTAGGILSGHAWSSNLGWINFAGVTINSSGEFLGYATIESDNSRINFNCNGAVDSCSLANFKVKTDWRPAGARSGGGHVFLPATSPSIAPPAILQAVSPTVESPIANALENASGIANSAYDSFLNFLKPQNEPQDKLIDQIIEVPQIAPVSLQTKWDLLPIKSIQSFVFAPLPREVRILAAKFPELGKTLKDVGIDRLSDMDKLSGVTFNIRGLSELEKILEAFEVEELAGIDKLKSVSLDIPGISDIGGEIAGGIGAGKIALVKGLPVVKFPSIVKQNLPAEFVFARANGELTDLNVAISIGEKGQVTQTISSLPGKTLRLVVKSVSRAKSVTGYLAFKRATPKVAETQTQISRSSLVASALFSMNDLVEQVPTKTSPPASLLTGEGGQRPGEVIPVEQKLVLSSFQYTDPDNDGIYTADVVSPLVPGEYEVITVIDYIDPALGVRQIRMIMVIDPEGYVFEKNNGKETRIPGAIVSLYVLNNAAKKYELWPAKDYQQENPQITDVRGTYSFLVPEGSYYFQVEAPGYDSYEGKAFAVKEGSGIHQNIELNSGWGLSDFDWTTVLLLVVLLLLVYNPVVRLYKKLYYRI